MKKTLKSFFRQTIKKYEFERDKEFLEKYGEDAVQIFMDEELWELNYFGHFDLAPLTLQTDAWGRRALLPSRNVPRLAGIEELSGTI